MADELNTSSIKSGEERFQIGNFELLRDESDAPLLLGKGAFGRTYKARHRFLDTIVAVKVINERYVADPVVRQRFLVEGRAVSRLSHPHIARLHDFGEAGGGMYYAMEFCSGGNLASHAQQHGALDVANLLDVAIQVAGALQCAHKEGFVHRDVKPSNIMLTGPNLPLWTKLIDFGLVHAAIPSELGKPGEDDTVAEGRFIGTPLFASPEQLREDPVDGRTDLFSLGMTLWYLAVGGSPEPGSSALVAASRLNSESYAQRLPTSLPDQFRALLASLLEKDSGRRMKDAGEAARAFKQCAATLGLHVSAESADADLSAELATTATLVEVPACPPAEIRSVDGPVASEWNLISRDAVALTGYFYSVESSATPGKMALAHVLHPELADDVATFDRIRVNVARIRSLALPPIIQPDEIIRYSDQTIIVMEKPAGGDLFSALRAQGVVNFSSAQLFLEAVAAASDQSRNANLPGVDLRPTSVFLGSREEETAASPPLVANATPRLLPRFLTSQDTVGIFEPSGSADDMATMTSDTFNDADREEDACGQFASLIYRIVSGRNCPAAASLSPQGFVAVPGLSEQANRILAAVIARQSHHATCGDLLHDLLGVEGVSGSVMPTTPTSDLTKKLREMKTAGSAVGSNAGVGSTGTRSVFHTATATAAKSPMSPLRPMPPPVVQPATSGDARKKLLVHSLMVASVLALGFVVLGVVLFRKGHPPQPPSPSLPEEIVLQLQDDFSIQPAFKIGNKAVTATRKGGEWHLPVREAAPTLPFIVTVEAVGYDADELTIHGLDEFSKPVPAALNRSTGKIAFVGIPAEYTQASCLMKDALPGEKDHVDIPKYAVGTELHGDATPPFAFPTGIYLVNLKGRAAPQRWPVTVSVKRAETFSLNLPPLVEGRYSGQVHPKQDGGEPVALELNVATRGSDGWIRRGNEQQALVEGRINADGAYMARALPLPAGGSESEATILIRPSDGGAYDVYLTHADATEAQNFTLLGTVHRSGDKSTGTTPNENAKQAPSPAPEPNEHPQPAAPEPNLGGIFYSVKLLKLCRAG